MEFYLLNRTPRGLQEAARTDVIAADGTKHGDAPRCDACGKYIGMRCWLPPYRVELDTWGRKFGDLAFQNVGADLLVSARFKRLYEEHELTGLISFEPVEIVNVNRHRNLSGEPPSYFKAGVYRSQTLIDQTAAGLEWETPPSCEVCGLGTTIKRWKGIAIRPETWTGEDIFLVRKMPGEDVITSPRFKAFCEVNEITNAVFIPAEEYGHDFYPGEKEPGVRHL
jgi:hypothetical protein